MSMKNWQAAAAAAVATLTVAGAVGFLTPGARADKVEKRVQVESEEFRDELRGHDTRITLAEANLKNLDQKFTEGNARVEGKLDKITDLLIRNGRRSGP